VEEEEKTKEHGRKNMRKRKMIMKTFWEVMLRICKLEKYSHLRYEGIRVQNLSPGTGHMSILMPSLHR